jgi:uncharacterized protein (TIGR02145 family)
MKKLFFFIVLFLLFSSALFAQMGINTDNSVPDNSAMLDVKSTNRGLLIPRITTAGRNQIPSPATGLLIYNTTTNQFNYYNGSFWYQLETTFISSTIGSLSAGGGVAINITPNVIPENSAMLDVNNPTRGILIPRTTQSLITLPATGLIIYDTITNLLSYYNGSQWMSLCAISTGIIGASGNQPSIGFAIKTDNSNPHSSAMLDVSATYKGILIPRLTNGQRDAILPVTGLVIYNTSANNIEFYNGSAWYSLNTDTLPIVTTAVATNITQSTATSGGDVTSDGGSSVTARGVCWSITASPTIADSHTSNGSGTGVFVSNLLGLTANTLYYVRAYATNSVGTAYGNEVTFTTLPNPNLPTVTTTAVTNIAQTTATSGGNVTSNGAAQVFSRGVCWSTSPNPTMANSHTTEGFGTGIFVSYLIGLTANTFYYVRAYATNVFGTSYGNQMTFSTLATLPTVTTTAVTNITPTTATSGGNVTSDGGATVTARGVCWSTSSNPTMADSHTTDGSGTGLFVSSLTGLTAVTLYYVRAYAVNSVGTAYGDEVSFTTIVYLPTITTTAITNITQTTATSGGNVTADGGATVTARGVCWSTTASPTIADSKTIDGSGTGVFVSSLGGLTAVTLYYVRAYATNSGGTAYGDEVSFTTIAYLPTITTTAITNITQTTATSGGNVTSDGGATVTARGVCWSTTPSPTIADSKTTDGSGTGVFVSSMTGLTAVTLYYVRAYAVNSGGTAYGDEASFTTIAYLPTVTTTAVTNITPTTAESGGNVTSDGGATVTARGVCWSTIASPTTSDSHTTNGSGTGVFVSNLAGLTPNTLYYVRAYATNIIGTSYGNQVTFSTLATLPTLTTTTVTNITTTTATSGGNVTSDGGATVIARGVCWNTTPNHPTIADSHTTDGTGVGDFVSDITGLFWWGTLYNVRAYATNSIGTAYGNELTFATLNSYPPCPDIPTVTYEGKTYNTVLIGTQCWFEENLNVGIEINVSINPSNNGIKEKYCYDDVESNCAIYGGLYKWDELMQYSTVEGAQGLCPTGWHIPTDGEWTVLNTFLGLEAGNKMKETGYTHWGYSNNGNNESGFTALPGGYLTFEDNFGALGGSAYFWTSSKDDDTHAWAWDLQSNLSGVYPWIYVMTWGFSARCVKN